MHPKVLYKGKTLGNGTREPKNRSKSDISTFYDNVKSMIETYLA